MSEMVQLNVCWVLEPKFEPALGLVSYTTLAILLADEHKTPTKEANNALPITSNCFGLRADAPDSI